MRTARLLWGMLMLFAVCAASVHAENVDAVPVAAHVAASAAQRVLPQLRPSAATAFDDRSVRRTRQTDAWAPDSDVSLFGNAKPLPSAQTQEGPAAYSLDIPLNPVLARYLAWYQTASGRSWLQRALERGAPFRDFIEEKLAAAHLPPELYFLALVESTFVVHAVSRSGAVGMWQFMENSVGNWMTISEWVDERRDFWKSTDAAIHKLSYNYEMLNNWLLAVAAYNAGLGYIQNLVQRTGIHDFWQLEADGYLPPETAAYVPKFLAVAAIGSYPGRYGLDLDWDPPYRWVRIPVERPVDLRVLSARAEIPLSVLQIGNAELNYGITPPGGHYLKVPVRYEQSALAAIKQSSLSLVRVYNHVVLSGDTYWNISHRFDVPMDLLRRFNPDMSPQMLRIGARIVIPIIDGAPDPATVEAAERALQLKSEPPTTAFDSTYAVKHGDTLWNIAQRYHVKPEELAAANGISFNSILSIGRILKVPARGAVN